MGCNKLTQEVIPQQATIQGTWRPKNYPNLLLEITDSTIIQRIGYPIIPGYSIRLVGGELKAGTTAKYSYVTALGTTSTFNLNFVSLGVDDCEVIRDFDPIKLRR